MNLLIAMFLLASTSTSEITRLTPAQTRELVLKGEAVVVDVRGSVPYALGHIAGAIWMPLGLIGERAGELPDDKLIVTYCTCKSEETSLEGARLLEAAGFSRVAVLLGGYPAWADSGYPTESNREPQAPPADSDPTGRQAGPGRLAPPAAVSCDRDHLTAYAGTVTTYRREAGKTTVTIKTSAGTVETVILSHPGTSDPSRLFLFESSIFEARHWKQVEERKGKLKKGMGAIAWVCQGGKTVIDWRPGAAFQGAE